MSLSRRRKTFWRSSQGYTLMELAITMAVAGMLMVSGVGLFAAIKKREREVKTKTEMENIRGAVLGYYQNHLVLPSPDSGYALPVDELDLSPNAQKDEIYAGKYYAYVAANEGTPFTQLTVDGQSIGSTAMVLISSGSNLRFDEDNLNLSDGQYTQEGTSGDFDDILVYLSGNELASQTVWRREIESEAAVLNNAAKILAENDDDQDGFVDEDSTDAPGNSDYGTDWGLVSGIQSLVNAGLLWNPDHLVDPWGVEYCWDSFNHEFYSAGPNKTDEGCGGDDICP
jgi:prepilin-type N-terminal cleavage/methylation domain-containing protein